MDTGKYILIKIDGTVQLVDVPKVREASYGEINSRFKALIDCEWLEFVYLNNRLVLIVDELGKLYNPPKEINIKASALYNGTMFGDPIVGDALLAAFDGIEDITGLNETEIETFMKSQNI